MLFLIQYNRKLGHIVNIKSFEDIKRQVAENTKLDMEIKLSRVDNIDEIVLLEASNEDALRITHGRYFDNIKELFLKSKVELTGHYSKI